MQHVQARVAQATSRKPASGPTMAIGFDVVKRWSPETLWKLALRHLRGEEKRREWNRAYSKTAKGRLRQKRYYYVKNDIYHPQLNPDGTHEKRWKRAAVDAHAQTGEQSCS